LWIKDTGWEDFEKGYINVTVGSMRKEDAKRWVALRHHIFLGDTIDGGVWEFEDKLPKYVQYCLGLTIDTIRGVTKGNGKSSEGSIELNTLEREETNLYELPKIAYHDIAGQCNDKIIISKLSRQDVILSNQSQRYMQRH